MGLLDWMQTPGGMGLLAAAAGTMAGARRGQPWNTAGRGALAGLAGYASANDQIRQDQENAFQRQYREMQMADIQRKMEQEKAQREWRAGLPVAMDAAKTKVTPFEADNPFGEDLGNLANVQQGNPQALQEYLLRPESPYADKFIEGMIPKPPKWAMGERFNEATGLPEKVIYDENDPTKVMPFGGQKQNIPEGMRLANGKLEAIPGYVAMRSQIAAAGRPTTITYAQPTPAFNPATGKVELVQFGNKAGAPPTPTGYEAPPTKAGGAGRLPASALKMQQAELDAVGTASGIQADLGAIKQQIDSGVLRFGPMQNVVNKARNAAGMSNESSRAFASFVSSLEKLRNDSLRLNTGVQTDGDAQRAWNELFQNINDTEFVSQRLEEIQAINERAVNLRLMNVENIRQNFGAEPLDTTGYQNQAPAIKAKPKQSGWGIQRVE